MDSSSTSDVGIRWWRTAFLTLRDETTTTCTSNDSSTSCNSSSSTRDLLLVIHNLIFNNESSRDLLLSAAPHLPPHELTSDLTFLLQLLLLTTNFNFNTQDNDDTTAMLLLSTCTLIHDISRRVSLNINSNSWNIIIQFLHNILLQMPNIHGNNPSQITKTLSDILDFLRNTYVNEKKCLNTENTQLLTLLLHILSFSNTNKTLNNLWECQVIAFRMIEETLSRIGTSLTPQNWLFTLEALRKIMDAFVSKGVLVEDSFMSRFYTSLLHCLHLLLSTPRASLSEHVAGLIAALRMFFVYGLTNRSQIGSLDTRHKDYFSNSSRLVDSSKPERGAYRPPHLRKRDGKNIPPFKSTDAKSLFNNETSLRGFSSSDSEHSDSDGFGKDMDYCRSSKARIAAIICIQDLCQVDPKAVTAHLTMLLPTNDVLLTRKYEATLMTCLLFDPVVKARLASASALAATLTGHSSVFLQVAEYKESTKCGSFTALSSTLGQILMQLHSGILYMIQRETHNGLLASLFKVLLLLISATPYTRMPGEMLPALISTLRLRMIDGFPSRTDQSGLTAILLNCLGAAFSTSPPSLQVKELLREEISTDFVGASGKPSLLSLIFQFAERASNPTLSFEALQVLRAVSHNYPNIMVDCWDQVSIITHGLLRTTTSGVSSSESSARLLKGDNGNTVGSLGERCSMAAIKVLDECLRAISGFKGTEDVLDDRSLDTPFTSNSTRTKRISSAPSYGLDGPEISDGASTSDSSGSKQWCEAIENHLPLTLLHSSAMVRAASVTCFAGVTSSVFFSLAKEKQDYILSSSISASLHDEIPSVRSAACRAIGVIACFPQISQRAEILEKFIHAVEANSRDPLVSVRITASWALANICDLLRHRANDFDLDMCTSDSQTYSCWITLLAECALRLSKDGDKIKSNAVRALGNLSRFVRFTRTDDGASKEILFGDTDWLGRMVQAFVSCVTTGNVKVRWNVCHALSNLFMNETLKLEDMVWAPSVFSILLLLLRDSSNFKIRIHAAAALAVPSSRADYGSSFCDVVQGLEHVLENVGPDQISAPPPSFKYREALEKQLTSSTLHVLSLVSCCCSGQEPPTLKDFVVKKAGFLEEWFRSLLENSTLSVEGEMEIETQKKRREMVEKSMRSLVDVFIVCNKCEIAKRFEKLLLVVAAEDT